METAKIRIGAFERMPRAGPAEEDRQGDWNVSNTGAWIRCPGCSRTRSALTVVTRKARSSWANRELRSRSGRRAFSVGEIMEELAVRARSTTLTRPAPNGDRAATNLRPPAYPPEASPSVPVSFDKANSFRDNGARTHPRAGGSDSLLLVAWKAPAEVLGNEAILVATRSGRGSSRSAARCSPAGAPYGLQAHVG